MLAPFWRYVGPFGRKSAIINPIHLSVALVFFSYFFAVLTRSRPPFGSIFGAKLALSWGIWAQELALDGLVGLREALRLQHNSPYAEIFGD